MPLDNSKFTLLLIRSLFDEPEEIIRILSASGFRVVSAGDLKEAAEIAAEAVPDMLFIDIDHNTAGIAMLQELRKNRSTGGIPIFLIASATDEEFLSECLIDDNIDFITKPFRAPELVIRVQRQLSFLRARRTIRRQNEKLKRTLVAREKLFSVIAHDLRAPIGTIKMINAAIESQKQHIGDQKIEKLFVMIHETTEEAFNLLENLLRWTRVQNGTIKVYAAEFNIQVTVRQVVSLFKTIAGAKNIALINNATGILKVYADEDMVKTVLRNLLSNAIKFTYPGGEVTIETQDLDECVRICVHDNGKGISKEIQQKLLKANEYITTYGTHNEKGSGLGLVLVRDFVKLNKGEFGFHSQEGVGTTFSFTLPKTHQKIK